MNRLSKFWTASIAYVALTVGAGLSIMYNVLDTAAVRGPAFDWADLVTAVAAPGIVLLMVEMFVSRIWDGQRWQIQVIRWLATLAIGGVAMLASWTHGHDFMASRGQTVIVATAWPLAIDLLAIMATALILAGRRGHVAPESSLDMAMAIHEEATNDSADEWPEDVADGHVTQIGEWPRGHRGEPGDPQIDEAIDAWNAGTEAAWNVRGQELADEAEQFLRAPATEKPAVPVIEKIPEVARGFIFKMLFEEAPAKEIDEAVAQLAEVSLRTARRYRETIQRARKGGES